MSRRQLLPFVIVLGVIFGIAFVFWPKKGCASCQTIVAPTHIGVDLSELTPYSSAMEYCNRVRQSGSWSHILADGSPLTFDSLTGWPTSWTGGGRARLYINREIGPMGASPPQANDLAYWPAGTYHMTWGGTATTADILVSDSGANLTALTSNSATFTVATAYSKGVAIDFTNPAAGHIPQLPFTITADAEPCTGQWRSGFIADLQPFDHLRFMDWQKANNSPAPTWPGRAKTAHYSQATVDNYATGVSGDENDFDDGVSLEDMIDLVVVANKDPWFVLPDNATDTYITNFAQAVCAALPVGRRASFSVSNEPWNTGNALYLAAHDRLQAAGVTAGYTGGAYESGYAWYYQVLARTQQAQALIAAQCASNQYWVHVNVQNAGPRYTCGAGLAGCLSYHFLTWDPPGGATLAIKDTPNIRFEGAPYTSLSRTDGTPYDLNSGHDTYDGQDNTACEGLNQGPGFLLNPSWGATHCCTGYRIGICPSTDIRHWTVGQFQTALRNGINGPMVNAALHVAHLNAYALQYVTYEGGEDIAFSGGGAEHDQTLISARDAADIESGMTGVVKDIMAGAKNAGIDTFTWFQFQVRPGNFNSYGLCRWINTCPTDPKYTGLKAASDAH